MRKNLLFYFCGMFAIVMILHCTASAISFRNKDGRHAISLRIISDADLSQLSFKVKYDQLLFSTRGDDFITAPLNAALAGKSITTTDQEVGQIVWSAHDYFGAPIIRKGKTSLLSIQLVPISKNYRTIPSIEVLNISAFDTSLNNVKIKTRRMGSIITLYQVREGY